ncbi:hypothetical protein [Streptomyces sp. NPDC048606]|uniref:hypothetical protein n=1 Tax=Streptomyces sp. NPDC048606 TaxID=3154726 RepID=UPI00342D15DB
MGRRRTPLRRSALRALPEVAEAVLLAETEAQWPHAADVFDRLRLRRLDEEAPLSGREDVLFTLAELVAKVAHNASGMFPPYDHDAGWLIAPYADRLIRTTDDLALQSDLTRVLGGRPDAD